MSLKKEFVRIIIFTSNEISQQAKKAGGISPSLDMFLLLGCNAENIRGSGPEDIKRLDPVVVACRRADC